MLKRIIMAAAGLAATSGMVFAAVPANASVGPTQTSAFGEAGYYVTGDFAGFKYIQVSDYIRLADNQLNAVTTTAPGSEAGESVTTFATSGPAGSAPGLIGIEACSGKYIVQFGFVKNSQGSFDVVYTFGVIKGSALANCATAGLLSDLTSVTYTSPVQVLASGLPQGDTVGLRIARNSKYNGHDHHSNGHSAGVLVEYTSYATGDTGTSEAGWTHGVFSAEGAGVYSDDACMTDSLDNELIASRHDNVTDGAGKTANFESGPWEAYQQVARDGSGITYLSPKSSLASSRFMVFGGEHISNC